MLPTFWENNLLAPEQNGPKFSKIYVNAGPGPWRTELTINNH